MDRKVLVFADVKGNKLRNVSLESLAAARKIAGVGRVVASVFGEHTDLFVDTLSHHGADEVVTVGNSQLDLYNTDAYVHAYKKVIAQIEPDVILTGHTPTGRDVSPRVAASLQLGLVSDCIQVELEGTDIVFTRPIYAGKAFVKKIVKESTIFATLRPNNISALSPDTSRKAEINQMDIELPTLRTVIKEVVQKSTDGVDLSEARIVVAGGRGVKSAEGFAPLRELADVLSAGLGASRGACDSDYCDYGLQIGQTGKVVTPDLYIACGISGAIQHLAGMSSSKVIVAINKDPEAPIFQVADYGIVGDLFEIVPMLTSEFRQLLKVNC